MGMYGSSIMIEAKVLDLVAIMKDNLEKHIDEFDEAMIGYRKAAKAALAARLAAFENDESGDLKNLDLNFNDLPKPQSHEKDYDRAISMISMHQGETFKIDMDMYRKYVEDDWEWKRSFEAVTSSYMGM